jgi:hypothetical protein
VPRPRAGTSPGRRCSKACPARSRCRRSERDSCSSRMSLSAKAAIMRNAAISPRLCLCCGIRRCCCMPCPRPSGCLPHAAASVARTRRMRLRRARGRPTAAAAWRIRQRHPGLAPPSLLLCAASQRVAALAVRSRHAISASAHRCSLPAGDPACCGCTLMARAAPRAPLGRRRARLACASLPASCCHAAPGVGGGRARRDAVR